MKINLKNKNNYIEYSSRFKDLSKFKTGDNKLSRENKDVTGPARAISFGGSAVSLGEKIVKSTPLNKVVDFVYDNEVAYNAIYSLFIAGMLKPLLVLKSKNSDEKDKQMIATKNFLSAFIGSFMSFTIGGKLVKKSVDVIKHNLGLIEINGDKLDVVSATSKKAKTLAENILISENTTFKQKVQQAKANGYGGIKSIFKAFTEHVDYKPTPKEIQDKANKLVETCNKHKYIFDSNPKFVKEILTEVNQKSGTSLKSAYNTFWKNFAGGPITIGKVKLASILLPPVVAFLFAKKAAEKKQSISTLTNSKQYNGEKENTFKKFEKNKQIGFKGIRTDKAIDVLAEEIEKLSMTKFGEKSVKLLSKSKKPSPIMGHIESLLFVTPYWVINTIKSKKIALEQKLGLNIQTILVSVVASAASILIDWACDKPIDKLKDSYKNVLTDSVENIKQNLTKEMNMEQIKSLILDKCSNISGKRDILNRLANTDLFDKSAVEEAINSLAGKYKDKISKFKSLTIFTFVVRFLIPVLMVPMAGKLKVKLQEYKKKKEEESQAKEQTTAQKN